MTTPRRRWSFSSPLVGLLIGVALGYVLTRIRSGRVYTATENLPVVLQFGCCGLAFGVVVAAMQWAQAGRPTD